MLLLKAGSLVSQRLPTLRNCRKNKTNEKTTPYLGHRNNWSFGRVTPLLWGTMNSHHLSRHLISTLCAGIAKHGTSQVQAEPSRVARRAPSKARETLHRCVLPQTMPRRAHVMNASLSIWKSLLVPAWDTSLLFLTLEAATSLLWGHTLVTLAAIYMESNTTKLCLTASCRHLLGTGNKRKKTNRPFGQPALSKAPILIFLITVWRAEDVGTKTCTK